MYKINNNDFKILAKLKSFSNKLDTSVMNIPNNDFVYKDKVKQVTMDIIFIIVYCSYCDKTELNKQYSLFKSNLSLLDFLIDRFVYKGYFNERNAEKLLDLLVEINKMGNSYIKGLMIDESTS